MTLDPDQDRLPLDGDVAGSAERPSPLRSRSALAAALAVLPVAAASRYWCRWVS